MVKGAASLEGIGTAILVKNMSEHSYQRPLPVWGCLKELRSGRSSNCRMLAIQGNMLKVHATFPVALMAPVQVEDGNRLWMGDVWACEQDGDGWAIQIENHVALNDVIRVEEMADDFQHERPVHRPSQGEKHPGRDHSSPGPREIPKPIS